MEEITEMEKEKKGEEGSGVICFESMYKEEISRPAKFQVNTMCNYVFKYICTLYRLWMG